MVKVVWLLATAALAAGWAFDEGGLLDGLLYGGSALCWVALLFVHPRQLNEEGVDRDVGEDGISATGFENIQYRWFLGLAITGFVALGDMVILT